MAIKSDPKPVLDPNKIYLGDNGMCFCGEHAGASAKFTGRDISGQEVYLCTEDDLAEFASLKCEECGRR